ncbi:hypothetical protein MPSEU_000211700 [Mayamaea pseudoterrestris]|nr:hypothetical protein MPSEU_000211700 [Mayamaea pseudoterrestris]
MGCASSTEVTTDPHTGQQKTKKRLGGAYPGQRIPQHSPYVPPASAFNNNQAVAHFVAYGGGNALTLVQSDGNAAPQVGKYQPEYIQVTLPDGVIAGQTIHVQAPDGRLNAIIVPPGMGAGSTFTVEFAPPEAAAGSSSSAPYVSSPGQSKYSEPAASTQGPSAVPPPSTGADDGFASGFGNASHRPPTANAVPSNHMQNNYPTTSATLY